MPDEVVVVVSSDQVDVLAPPAEIKLTVGVGASGQRGSKILAGNSSPEVFFAAWGEVPLANDMYISISSQTVYQLISSPTGLVWVSLFSMQELSSEAISAAVASGVTTAMNAMFSITSPTNGQFMKYNSTSEKWENHA